MALKLKAAATSALDLQLDFIKYYQSDEGKIITAAFLESMIDSDQLNGPVGMSAVEYAANTGFRIAQEIVDHLGVAPTYYLVDDMMDLTLHAGEQIPSIRFHEQDLPTTNGFVLLPRPLITIDCHDHPMTARALTWWKSEVNVEMQPLVGAASLPVAVPALMFALFSNKNDWQHDRVLGELRTNDPKMWMQWPTWQLCHWAPIFFDDAFGYVLSTGDQVQVKLGEYDSPKETEGLQNDSFYAFLRTFFLLVKQRVAVTHPQHPDRAGMRRWTAAGLIPEMGTMQIVTLRKERPATEVDGDGDPVAWSHRWIVSGHWRNQWYPTLSTHIPVWINSHVKGPEDRPLIVKDKVFVWKR